MCFSDETWMKIFKFLNIAIATVMVILGLLRLGSEGERAAMSITEGIWTFYWM